MMVEEGGIGKEGEEEKEEGEGEEGEGEGEGEEKEEVEEEEGEGEGEEEKEKRETLLFSLFYRRDNQGTEKLLKSEINGISSSVFIE